MGQRILRREDSRFLRGKGRYVENLDLPGALHATFVRSLYAHARVVGDRCVSGVADSGNAGVHGGRRRPWHVPAAAVPRSRSADGTDRSSPGTIVRFAGDIVAVVLTETRAEGVDAAEVVIVEYDPLPAVVDPRGRSREVLLFPEAGTNVCNSRSGRGGRDAVRQLRDGRLGRLVSQRLAASPLESRACVATSGRRAADVSGSRPRRRTGS